MILRRSKSRRLRSAVGQMNDISGNTDDNGSRRGHARPTLSANRCQVYLTKERGRSPRAIVATGVAIRRAASPGLVEHLEINDSVCAEMPEALTELAPGDQQAARLGIAEDYRPYRSIGFLASLGPVAEPHF